MSQIPAALKQYPDTANFPIAFEGADPNGHHAFYFVKDEDAGSSKYRTHLSIENISGGTIKIEGRTNLKAKLDVLSRKSAEYAAVQKANGNLQPLENELKTLDEEIALIKPHFVLRFRPGLVNGRMVRKMMPLVNELESQMGAGWRWFNLNTSPETGVMEVSFSYTGDSPLFWGHERFFNIQLRPVHDAPLSGAFFLKMELDYSGVYTSEDPVRHRLLNLAVVDLSGRTFFPVKADVVGSNTILNDRETPNTRTLHLWNTLAHSSVPIRSHGNDHESGTMITLAMRCHSGLDLDGIQRHPTVMGTRSQVAATTLTATPHRPKPEPPVPNDNWTTKRHEDVPGWVSWEINAPHTNSTYFINHDPPGKPDNAILDSLEIKLENLISSAPDGISNIYIHFHHVPGYADHTLIVPLEKTPLVVRGQNVGIGALPSEEGGGNLRIKGNINNAFVGNVGHGDSWAGIVHKDVADKLNGYALLQNSPGSETLINVKGGGQIKFRVNNQDKVAIDENGNVGIGTTDPSAKLHVNGDIKSGGRIKDKTGDLMPVGSIIAYGGSKIPEGWLLCDGREINEESYRELCAALGKTKKIKEVKEREVNKQVWNRGNWNYHTIKEKYLTFKEVYQLPDLRSRFIVGSGQGNPHQFEIKGKWHPAYKSNGQYLGWAYHNSVEETSFSSYDVTDRGGEEEHTLTIDEMPKHHHIEGKYDRILEYTGEYTLKEWDKLQSKEDGLEQPDLSHSKVMPEVGNNQPHNNIPPYYALTYIIKY